MCSPPLLSKSHCWSLECSKSNQKEHLKKPMIWESILWKHRITYSIWTVLNEYSDSKGSVAYGKRIQSRRLKSSYKWKLTHYLCIRNLVLYRITYRNQLKIGWIGKWRSPRWRGDYMVFASGGTTQTRIHRDEDWGVHLPSALLQDLNEAGSKVTTS